MGEFGYEKNISLGEQALFLLDTSSAALKNREVEIFLRLDGLVRESFGTEPVVAKSHPIEPMNQSPFSVASRLTRSNYEDQARAEALMNALKTLRSRRANASAAKNSRILRNT